MDSYYKLKLPYENSVGTSCNRDMFCLKFHVALCFECSVDYTANLEGLTSIFVSDLEQWNVLYLPTHVSISHSTLKQGISLTL